MLNILTSTEIHYANVKKLQKLLQIDQLHRNLTKAENILRKTFSWKFRKTDKQIKMCSIHFEILFVCLTGVIILPSASAWTFARSNKFDKKVLSPFKIYNRNYHAIFLFFFTATKNSKLNEPIIFFFLVCSFDFQPRNNLNVIYLKLQALQSA